MIEENPLELPRKDFQEQSTLLWNPVSQNPTSSIERIPEYTIPISAVNTETRFKNSNQKVLVSDSLVKQGYVSSRRITDINFLLQELTFLENLDLLGNFCVHFQRQNQ